MNCLNLLVVMAILLFSAANNSDFRLDLARKYAKKGQLDEAAVEYKNYLLEDPASAAVYEELARLRMLQGKYKLAVINFRAALRVDPEFMDAQEGLALAYEQGGEIEKAIAEWRKLATMSSSSIQAQKSEKHIEELLRAYRKGQIEPQKTDAPSRELPVSKEKESVAKPGAVPAAEVPKPKSTPPQPAPAKPAQAVQPQEKTAPAAVSPDKKVPAVSKGLPADEQDPFKKAVALVDKKEYDAALKEIHSCLKKNPGHPGAYYYAGIIRYEKGEMDKAAFNFKKSFDYPEKGYNGHFYLGRIHHKAGKKKEALSEYRTYIKLTQSEEGKAQALKFIEELTGKEEKKESVKSTEKEPKVVEAVSGKDTAAPVHIQVRNISGLRFFIPNPKGSEAEGIQKSADFASDTLYEKAINSLKKVILEYGGTSEAAHAGADLAVLYEKIRLHQDAVREAEDFLSLHHASPAAPYIRYVLAKSLLKLNRADEAQKFLKDLQAEEKYGPSPAELTQIRADLNLSRKNYPQAISNLKKMADKTDNPSEKVRLQEEMAELYLESGRKEKAYEMFKMNSKICTDTLVPGLCSEIYIKMGDLLYQQKKWTDADRKYRQFLEKFPDHEEVPWVLYQLANLHRKQGQYKDALEAYKSVIDKYPESYWAKQAKWKRDDAIWKNEFKEILN